MQERDRLVLFAYARALLAAVRLTAAWQRNLFHSKTSSLNGENSGHPLAPPAGTGLHQRGQQQKHKALWPLRQPGYPSSNK